MRLVQNSKVFLFIILTILLLHKQYVLAVDFSQSPANVFCIYIFSYYIHVNSR